MDKNWTLREALYRAFHNWPSILAFISLGCVLGWLSSFIWPSHYRATSEIYVALNPYRKFSDTNFEALANPKYSNLDNYHYWQMSQLNSAIFQESFLQATLDSLQEMDSYWKTVDLDQLRGMLETEWRSSGTWGLIANHSNSLYAQQAANAWSSAVVVQVPQAVTAARNTFMIDQQLETNEATILQATLRQRELNAAQQILDNWQKTSQDLPRDSIPDPATRWQILAAFTRLADFSPAWINLLESQPADGATVQAYLDWIALATPALEVEATTMQQRILYLDQQQIDLASQFSIESQKSLGFSPNIEIKRKEDLAPREIRLSSTLLLVGGIIGLLIWLLTQLIIITNIRRSQ